MAKSSSPGMEESREVEVKVKQEPRDDIKDFAENTMNELLGWYGYDKVDSEDTQHLHIRGFVAGSADAARAAAERAEQGARVAHRSDSEAEDKGQSEDSGPMTKLMSKNKNLLKALNSQPSSPQRILSDEDDDSMDECPDEDMSTIVCAWCLKPGTKQFTLKTNDGVKAFCSDRCFNQCRRASFKKNKVCDWCKHVRSTMNYVDFQDGDHQLQFCGDKCLNQYKMNIFCKETQAHIQQIQAQLEASGQPPPTESPQIMITPDLWMKGGKAVTKVLSTPPSDTENMAALESNRDKESTEITNKLPVALPPTKHKIDLSKSPDDCTSASMYSVKPKGFVSDRSKISMPQGNHNGHCVSIGANSNGGHSVRLETKPPKIHHTQKLERTTCQRRPPTHPSQPWSPPVKHVPTKLVRPPRPVPTTSIGPRDTPGSSVTTSPQSRSSSAACSTSPIGSQLFRPPTHGIMPFMHMNPGVPMFGGPMPGMAPPYQPPYSLAAPPPHVSMILPCPMFIPVPIPIPIPIPICPHMDYGQNDKLSNNRSSSSNLSEDAENEKENSLMNGSVKEDKNQNKVSKEVSESPCLEEERAIEMSERAPSVNGIEKVPINCACCQSEKHCPPSAISPLNPINGNLLGQSRVSTPGRDEGEVIDLSQEKVRIKEEPRDPPVILPISMGSPLPAPLFLATSLALPPPADHAYSRRRGRILDAPPPPRDKSESPPPDKRYCRRTSPRDIYARKGSLRPRMRSKLS